MKTFIDKSFFVNINSKVMKRTKNLSAGLGDKRPNAAATHGNTIRT